MRVFQMSACTVIIVVYCTMVSVLSRVHRSAQKLHTNAMRTALLLNAAKPVHEYEKLTFQVRTTDEYRLYREFPWVSWVE